jgi:hypothetical protein
MDILMEPDLKIQIEELSKALDELVGSFMDGDIGTKVALNNRALEAVVELLSNYSIEAIACVIAHKATGGEIKGMAAKFTMSLKEEEIKNRSKNLGKTTKKQKKQKAELMIKWWDELDGVGCSKEQATLEIHKRLTEAGFRVAKSSVRRDLTAARLEKLRHLYRT